MKQKLFFLFIALMISWGVKAQAIDVYYNGNLEQTYLNLSSNEYKVVFRAVLLNGVERAFRPRVIRVCIFHAGLAGNGKTRRHGQADKSHFGEVRALAAKDVLHILVAFSNVVALSVLAERVDTLNVCSQCLLLTYEV